MPGQLPNPEDPHARHASTPAELVQMNAAKRRGLPLLSWRDEDGELQTFDLEAGEYLIGRRPTMSVVIGWDSKVSALHAKLECAGGEWVISDNGLSTNGTWVNGQRIYDSTRLRNRDVIRVGSSLIAFHAALADADVTPTVPEGSGESFPVFDDKDRKVLIELCRDYVEHGRPSPVDNNRIACALDYGVDMVKQRLREMYARCRIDPDDELPRGAKRAELMALVVRHGTISPRDYAAQPDRERS